MGKFYETSSTFNYNWSQIVRAFWKRYPNPFSPHILTEDTLTCEVRGNQLYSRKLITKTYRVPSWGQRFVKSNTVPIVEESYVNPESKVATTYTRNICYTRLMSVVEKVTYTPDPSNPEHTIASRSAWIESSMYGFRRAVEKFGVENFKKNCIKTENGLNHVLRRLFPTEGRLNDLTTAAVAKEEGPKKRRLFPGIPKLTTPI